MIISSRFLWRFNGSGSYALSHGLDFLLLNRYLAVLGHVPVIMITFWNSADLAHKSKVSLILPNAQTSVDLLTDVSNYISTCFLGFT